MTYNVLIQHRSENTYQATVLGWPDLIVTGGSEQEALEAIRHALRERLAQSKIVQIEIDEPASGTAFLEHLWQPYLGMWKNDPTFDGFLDNMQAYRHELDEKTTS